MGSEEKSLEEYTKADVIGVYAASIHGFISYVMLLKGIDWDDLVLPIYIGAPEAMAIDHALKGYQPRRPLTHDLIISILGALGVSVEKVTIDALIENVYTATIVLTREENGKKVRYYIDARPSDSVALALRAGAPIYVANRLKAYAISEETIRFEEEEE